MKMGKNRNSPKEFARQVLIKWLFWLTKLTYAQVQTVQPSLEIARQKSPDTFPECGKDQTI